MIFTMKLLSILVPPLLTILIALFIIPFAVKKIKNIYIVVSTAAICGIIGSAIILVIISLFSKYFKIAPPNLHITFNIITGLTIGLTVSGLSALSYYIVNKPKIVKHVFFENLTARTISNISSATLEEVAFRAGIVHLMNAFWGKTIALIGGSVPFGLVHLIGRFFGGKTALNHVIGCSLAGLLLSIVYIKFGIFSAIATHWIWNSLCGSWVRTFNIPLDGGAEEFEGAWSTTVVLSIMSLVLLLAV